MAWLIAGRSLDKRKWLLYSPERLFHEGLKIDSLGRDARINGMVDIHQGPDRNEEIRGECLDGRCWSQPHKRGRILSWRSATHSEKPKGRALRGCPARDRRLPVHVAVAGRLRHGSIPTGRHTTGRGLVTSGSLITPFGAKKISGLARASPRIGAAAAVAPS